MAVFLHPEVPSGDSCVGVRCPSCHWCNSTYLSWPNVASRVFSVHSWMTKLLDAQSKAKGEREGAVQPQKEQY